MLPLRLGSSNARIPVKLGQIMDMMKPLRRIRHLHPGARRDHVGLIECRCPHIDLRGKYRVAFEEQPRAAPAAEAAPHVTGTVVGRRIAADRHRIARKECPCYDWRPSRATTIGASAQRALQSFTANRIANSTAMTPAGDHNPCPANCMRDNPILDGSRVIAPTNSPRLVFFM
jgi:hypothetical protein